ncbi:MAG: nucleoside diphosphate kinase regulator [Sphingobium sp.]
MTKPKGAVRPPVHMIDSEADAIADLAIRAQERQPELSSLLLGEIDRAKIYSAARIPADIVTMHSRVEFIDESTGASRTIELVWPADADISVGRISILTPIGAGLIGLRKGGAILWPDRDGRQRTLNIVSVTQPDAPKP